MHIDLLSQSMAELLNLGKSPTSATATSESGEENFMKQKLFKSKVCRFYATGRCKYGHGCTFAHSANELRPSPDFRKTKLCSRPGCDDPTCTYAHGLGDVRWVTNDNMCVEWLLTGACTHSITCPFAHNTVHLDELRVAQALPSPKVRADSDSTLDTDAAMPPSVLSVLLQAMPSSHESFDLLTAS